MDSTSWQQYAKIDPELEAMLPHLPPSKSLADYGSVYDLRKGIDEQIAQGLAAGIFKPADLTGIKKEEIQIPTRDGATIGALHYRPESGEKGPIVVYYHGGGWTFGGPENWETTTANLVKELGFIVVSVDYRMAPEVSFPVATNDGYDAVKWVAENASKLQGDPAKGFLVAGTSAGGNIAAVVAHEAADAKLSPPLTGQLLSVPVLVHPDAVPEQYKPHYQSWEQNKDAMILDQRGMNWFYEQYKNDPHSKYTSPLIWPGGHKGQPPAYFQVCGMDPLRDEALIYEYVLREECGVPTRLSVYSGIPHAGNDFLPMLSQAKQSARDTVEGAKWLLDQVSK